MSRKPEVAFHFNAPDRLVYACRLLRKAYLKGARLLVLADEPTGNLDEATSDRVFGEFLNLVRNEGSAALVATHNERLAKRMDRVVRLHEGRLEEMA